MKVPKYLDRDFLRTVLRNGFNTNDDFDIVAMKVEIATSPGDNYTSTIYRVFLTFVDGGNCERNIQFLVKHLTEQVATLVDFMDLFEKEIIMLKEIVPRLQRSMNGAKFSARYYYHCRPGPQTKVLAMEDLKELHYQMAQRREGLDFEHCRIALRKLGQMHAASMALVDEDPSLMDKFNFGMFHGSVNNPGQIQLSLPLSFPLLCERVKSWKGFEGIYRKLNRMKENFWPMMYESTSRKHDGYRVLTHGDFWTNNFLYKYNETSGKPIDVLFVDLQHSCYTSPANDLQYFLSISPQNHVREQHREELVRIYYESFAATLNELNYSKIPTFAELQDEMRKKEMLGFFAAVFVLPIALMEEQSTQGSGLDGLMDEEARKEMTWLMISGKSYTEAIKPILKRCDNLGVFDLQSYQGDSNY